MTFKRTSLLLLTFLITLSGCSKDETNDEGVCQDCLTGPQTVTGFNLKMADELTYKQRTSVTTSLGLIESKALSVSDPELISALGGNDSAAIRGYLNERIKYLGGNQLMHEANQASISPKVGLGVTVATNIGIGLWMDAIIQNDNGGEVTLQGQKFELTTGHVGIVVLGKGYNTALKDDFNRLLTFLHEARHSDCTQALDDTDIQYIIKKDADSLVAKNPRCGHLHAICPSGHQFAGLPACDSHAWGAYTLGAVFAENFYKNCSNCLENEKQILLAASIDSKSRLLSGALSDLSALDLVDRPQVMRSISR